MRDFPKYLGGVVVQHSPIPPYATLPFGDLPVNSIVWHLPLHAVGYLSYDISLLAMAPEFMLPHASKYNIHLAPGLCIHFMHTVYQIHLLVHGRKHNLGS